MAKKKKKTELCIKPRPLAKTFAIICGAYLFLAALIPALGFNVLWWNNRSLATLAAFYPGIAPTILGAVIGLVWGVISGAVLGLVIGWIYKKVR